MSEAWPVHRFETIDSTNSEARRRAKAGGFADCWIVAAEQTAGRGRLQRHWVSPKGNLFTTALFHEPGGVQVAARLPFAASLAVSDTILHFAPGADARLKWPNDVRVDGGKVSGILIETGQDGKNVWVAAGMGLNVAEAPEGTGQPVTSLRILAPEGDFDATAVFEVLAARFAARLEQARTGFASVRLDWLARAEGLGKAVRIAPGGEPVEGVFEDMAPDGALILRLPDGSRQTIRAGDVQLVGGN
ncbi:MAG: biotin--[acetyl-CoA-carboxylase] ligase [Hyphomonas sp.]|nr:biotin--[acetyl-CoA-carboxylase] ligase [Hyphomonas sp.]MCB9961544.1 biotin--[acetyl-CoA-carboxylase] ligase [Hyphomonas sp.]MCB9971720.1 biotin--[acetyl-CoA-carboxylase] ligase [Hyphomonas sp.]